MISHFGVPMPSQGRQFYPEYQGGSYGHPFNTAMMSWNTDPSTMSEFHEEYLQQYNDPQNYMNVGHDNCVPRDESELDFSNFPWLPDFDQALNHNAPAGSHTWSQNTGNGSSTNTSTDSSSDFSGGESSNKQSGKRKLKEIDISVKSEDASVEGESTVDRRERNRLNAKKARLRKKQLLGSLQGQLSVLRGENAKLRRLIAARIPEKSVLILNKSKRLAEMLAANAP